MKQQIKPIDACRLDLFTGEEELREKYDMRIVARILRVREEYNWFLSNPDAKDRQFVETAMSRHDINKTQAYSDLAIVKALLPMMSQASFQLVQHEPFTSITKAVEEGQDIKSTYEMVEMTNHRMMVKDTDIGEELEDQINDLKLLLEAYRNGDISERSRQPITLKK